MTKKKINDGVVDSSLTSFFLVSVLFYSIVLSFVFTNASTAMLVAVVGYAVLTYFIWDIIRQLFYPGQAVFLYVAIYIFLPILMNYFLQYSAGLLAVIIYTASLFTAWVLELLYERVIKKRTPKHIMRRLLAVDAKLDKSIMKLSVKHLQLTEFRGLVIALGLATLYMVTVLLLLHR